MKPSNRIPYPIAVVGMSFKFAGDAISEEAFWNLLLEGRSAADAVPANRYNADNFYHHDYNRLDTLPNRVGYFMKDDSGAFDAPFFSIKAEEAAAMDPQSRVLLETTYRALENAGIPVENCAKTKTSVYIGCSSDDYQKIYTKDTERPIRHAGTGMARSMLANKISWFYDLHGPSMVIDTACSAALNGVHLGCQDIWTGQSRMAFVGGVNLTFTPDSQAPLSHLGFFSPDGKCYSFDHRANGYSRGEGYGMFILKPLQDAIRDRDSIRAVIRSTGSNENGRTPGGITKVNAGAQAQLIRDTYARAGLDLTQTRYVEAHGPGTAGDVVESAALYEAFGQHRSQNDPLFIGSVKANIGHLEGAAGVSALVKTILVLERGVIPRLANFERLNPEIAAKNYPFLFSADNIHWPAGLRRASIDSFGFGGSNAHLVIEDARECQASLIASDSLKIGDISPTLSENSFQLIDSENDGSTESKRSNQPDQKSTGPHQENQNTSPQSLLVFSAADQKSLQRIAEQYRAYSVTQASQNGREQAANLRNLAYTLSQRRSHLARRAFTVVRSWQDLSQLEERLSTGTRTLTDPGLAFVFTGQGAQWAGMGSALLAYPVFYQTLLQCQAVINDLGCTWDILDELQRPSVSTKIYTAEYSQPLCTIVQVALVELLYTYNIKPIAVIGHSSGEIAAAYCAGHLSLESACKVAFLRGLYSSKMEQQANESFGMMAVNWSLCEAERHLAQSSDHEKSSSVAVACINSPTNVTLSGNKKDLEALESTLKEESIFARLLHVKVPYHSALMTSIGLEYQKAIDQLEPGLTRHKLRFFSSLRAEEVTTTCLFTSKYWFENLVSPVNFSGGLQSLLESTKKDGIKAFVEIGPHPALQMPIHQILEAYDSDLKYPYHASLYRRKDDALSFLSLVGSLYALGFPVSFNTDNTLGETKLLRDLPEYPFDHSKSYWHESRLSKNYRFRKYPRSDFIGVRSPDWNYLNATWRNIIRPLENPWIEDHKIDGIVLYPGAGMLVMAIEAAAQHSRDLETRSPKGFRLKNVSFLKSLNISSLPQGTETQITLRPVKDPGDRKATWSLFSIFIHENDEWNEVCRGKISIEFEEESSPLKDDNEKYEAMNTLRRNLETMKKRCDREVEVEFVYRRLHESGLDLGPTFRSFTKVQSSQDQEAFVTINPRTWTCKTALDQASPHFVHPTTLDGVVQIGIISLSRCGRDSMPSMVPSRIRSMWVSANGLNGTGEQYLAEPRLSGYADSRYSGYRGATMNVTVLGETHESKILIEGLETTFIDTAKAAKTVQKLCSRLYWEPIATSESSTPISTGGKVIQISHPEDLAFVASNPFQMRLAVQLQHLLTAQSYQQCRILNINDIELTSLASIRTFVFLLDVKQSYFASINSEAFNVIKQTLLQVKDGIWIQTIDLDSTFQIAGEAVGLLRSLRTENPERRLTSVQVEMPCDLPKAVMKIVSRAIEHEGNRSITVHESEILVKKDYSMYVNRLREDIDVNTSIATQEKRDTLSQRRFGDFDNLKLGISTPGSLDTLQFETDPKADLPLGDDEIEVRPVYCGLNFMDLLTALGRIPQDVLGIECSGIVIRSGSNSDLNPGDRVMLCTDGTFKSRTRCHYQNAIRLPDDLSLEDAAGIPAAGYTAYHALINVARLEAGETVLIHAGAGATGQMAIQVAQACGAEIFVTVGSKEKMVTVQNFYGIPKDHIFYSRNTSFADDVRRATKGQGVDVILNSLAGDSLIASWECIAPFGRFIEIGKRDIFAHKDLPMFPFAKNVSFHTVDLSGLWIPRPALMRRIAEGVLKLWRNAKLNVTSLMTTFPIYQVEDAFRLLQSGKSIGKVMLEMETEDIVPIRLAIRPKYTLKSDTTYVVVGAFGGLGQSAATWLVERGAKNLLLLSRSGPSTEEAQNLIRKLNDRGVRVSAPACDVSDYAAISKCIAECSQQMPPIEGCIQASMVLRDQLFEQMTFDQWQQSLAPKADGSWNLHLLLPKQISFFILLSSTIGIFGGRGQSNYSAGNTFQDALARHRVSLGLKAISLDLGMMQDVGVLTKDTKLMQFLNSEGFYLPMTETDFHTLLDRYCDPALELSADSEPQLVCGLASAALVRKRGRAEPNWMKRPLFNSLWSTKEEGLDSNGEDVSSSGYRTVLETSATAAEAAKVISNALVQRLSRSLGVPESDIDPARALHFYGVDSLVAVELRNWFSRELQTDIAVFEILGNRGCDSLAMFAVMHSNYTKAEWSVETSG